MHRKYWIIPCNIEYDDIVMKFEELKEIEWKQELKDIQVDDIIYIYVAQPHSKIMYKCRVNKVNLIVPSVNKNKDDNKHGSDEKYMELQLIETYDSDYFHYDNLKKNGFKNPRRQTSASDDLVAYLEEENMFDHYDKTYFIIKNYMKHNDEKYYNDLISDTLMKRNQFVSRFTIDVIKNLEIDDYVLGRSSIDARGKESFCYLMEVQLKELGEMRGAYVNKLGVWYDKQNRQYRFTNKYGRNLEEAFARLKQEIVNLIIAGSHHDVETIEKSIIAPLLKGKILSTYFPEDYLCIFDEEDIDCLLKELNIYYNPKYVKTLESKKTLLQKWKKEHALLKKVSNYYFIKLLYDVFMPKIMESKLSNDLNGEILYQNFKQVEVDYLQAHERQRPLKNVGFKKADYKIVNENKKRVGDRGENAIVNFEKDRLSKLGYLELAEKVAIVDNDAAGYDVLSYEIDGTPKHIEVKTNSSQNTYIQFYLTDNELDKVKNDLNHSIYYLFDIKSRIPKFTIIDKNILLEKEKEFLKPVLFKIEIDIQEKDEISQ